MPLRTRPFSPTVSFPSLFFSFPLFVGCLLLAASLVAFCVSFSGFSPRTRYTRTRRIRLSSTVGFSLPRTPRILGPARRFFSSSVLYDARFRTPRVVHLDPRCDSDHLLFSSRASSSRYSKTTAREAETAFPIDYSVVL